MALLLLREKKDYQAWLEALEQVDASLEVVTPETVKEVEQVDMIMAWKAPKGSFKAYPNLKVIGSMGAGVDHLFEDPSLPKNAIITRLVDEKLAGDMQEFVLSLCLNFIKNISPYQQQQSDASWNPLSYQRTADVRVGILGLGTLGQAVGLMLRNVGFKVSGWSHTRKEVEGIISYAQEERDAFLAETHILVCLLPLTKDTRGILNASLFSKLPNGAYLINVARGAHLVEDDLIKALDNKQLSGAALDVFNNEPLPKHHPFWGRKDILITPHVASLTNPISVAPQIVENYRRMEKGEKLKNTVSQKRGY